MELNKLPSMTDQITSEVVKTICTGKKLDKQVSAFTSENQEKIFSFRSSGHLAQKFKKPLQRKSFIPPGLEQYSFKARAFSTFSLTIQAIREVLRKKRVSFTQFSSFSSSAIFQILNKHVTDDTSTFDEYRLPQLPISVPILLLWNSKSFELFGGKTLRKNPEF